MRPTQPVVMREIRFTAKEIDRPISHKNSNKDGGYGIRTRVPELPDADTSTAFGWVDEQREVMLV